MVQLNLLPDVKKEFLRAQRTRTTVVSIASLVAAIVVGIVLVLGVILGGQAIQKTVLNNDIDKNFATLNSVGELEKYLTVQNQLAHVNNLHNSEPVYSRLFSYLQQLNPANPNSVRLDTVKIASSEDGTSAEISGKTASFPALDVYKTTMAKAQLTYTSVSDNKSATEPLFQSVDVASSSLANSANSSGVTFTVNVTFSPNAFAGNIKDVKIKVPSEVTSGADKNAPQHVFTDGTKDETGVEQ